jgi:chaperone BCS1
MPTNLHEVIDWLWQQAQSNQFLTGGFVLGALGCIAAYLRNFPRQIYEWCKRRVFIDFEIPMTDEAFYWFNDWLAAQPYTHKRARRLSVRTTSRTSGPRNPQDAEHQLAVWSDGPDSQHVHMPEIVLSPAPGRHVLWFKRHLLVVDRERQEKDAGTSLADSSHYAREKYDVSVMAWDRNIIKEILAEARKAYYPPGERRVRVCVHNGDSWRHSSRRPRAINSVIWPEGQMENLIADATKFISAEQWYVDLGIPYRRGYLLKGPPGNGKSSGVIALASHLGMSIYIVNLGERYLSDATLQRLLSDVDRRSIVLIEDVDCAFADRENDDKTNELTFSGVLNAIDGVAASEGRLLFLTTNHPEKLDPALIRDGRCDMQLEIGNATPDQAERMFMRFFPNAHIHGNTFEQLVADGTYSMAQIQGHLLKHRRDPWEAIQAFESEQERNRG